ncbi:oxygenase MpaB family protein [Planctomonas psychrotolerans]|uniref:oxygenase MpaB family protein n=1 Tax=Planctomonas psychrotolerans TaxID=2528712 RepID=UPI00123B99BC|nr:oxygenase MpaB family protein [Planctomonas psychrotolerans]
MRGTRRERPVHAADIAAEAVLIGAGGRAILLQLADPAVGRGVAEHSDFETRPTDRLTGTLTFAYAVVCGSESDIRLARRRVNAAHATVRGARSDAGPAYSASHPELQLWVAATLYDSAVTMHELVYGPLDDATADALYAAYAPLATELGMPPDLWPADRAAFGVYWADRLATLSPGELARDTAARVLFPASGPLWLRLSMPLARLVTAGLLTPRLRTAFGLAWSPRRERAFTAVLAVTRAVYPRLPRTIRHLPKTLLLRRLRRDA